MIKEKLNEKHAVRILIDECTDGIEEHKAAGVWRQSNRALNPKD